MLFLSLWRVEVQSQIPNPQALMHQFMEDTYPLWKGSRRMSGESLPPFIRFNHFIVQQDTYPALNSTSPASSNCLKVSCC